MPHGCDDRAPLVCVGDDVVQLGVMREVEHGAMSTGQAYSIVSVRVYGPDGKGVFQERHAFLVIQPGFCALIAEWELQGAGIYGDVSPAWTGDVLLETPLLKPIPSCRQPRKPQPRRVTVIVLTRIRHDVQDSFSHKPILAGAWACIPWTDGSTTFKKDTSPRY